MMPAMLSPWTAAITWSSPHNFKPQSILAQVRSMGATTGWRWSSFGLLMGRRFGQRDGAVPAAITPTAWPLTVQGMWWSPATLTGPPTLGAEPPVVEEYTWQNIQAPMAAISGERY